MTIQLLIDSKFNSAGVQAAETRVRQMVTGLNDLFAKVNQSGLSNTESFMAEKVFDGNFEQKAQKNIAVLDQYIAKLRQAANAAQAVGNIDAFQSYDSAANQVQSLTDRMRESLGVQEKQGGALDFINNKFNKFAFGLFVVTGAINTVTRAIGQMTDALIEGASIADRSNAFNVLLENAGVNAEAMRAQLIGASQGAITLDSAMRPTLQLMKAGVPEVANMSGKLLEMAVASAKLSGDLGATDEIYTTLIRGIVRGSPRLIDNADIYLKLGDANEKYAASIGKTVEELTAQEKIIATARAVEEQGDSIIELAEQVDSAAITFQNFKTDAKEAGQILLSSSAEAIGGAIEWVTDLVLSLGEATGAMYGFSDETQESLRTLNEAFAENPFSMLAEMVVVAGTIVSEVVKFIIEVFHDLGRAVFSSISVLTTYFEVTKGLAEGTLTAAQAHERLKEAVNEQKEATLDAIDASEEWNNMTDSINDKAREALINLGVLAPEMDKIATEAEAAAERTSVAFDQISNAIQDAIDARTGPEAQLSDKRADIEEDLAEKIVDINEGLAEKLKDISAGLQEKLIDLNTKYQQDLEDLAEKTAEKLQDIDENLAESLSSATEEANDKRADAVKDHNKGIEDAHEDHQKKLIDIEKKYEASRLKALIDRDARALFEAEQARSEGRADANDDLEEQIKDEEEALQEKMEEINKLEEERRKDAIEAAEERRRDALKAQEKELADLKENFQKQKREAAKDAAEKRQEAIKSANERRRDAQDHYRDSLQDLDEWYREQLILRKERQLQEKISELEHLEEMGELTQAHLDDLKNQWGDYNDFVNGASGAGGSGGSGGIGTGGTGSGGSGGIGSGGTGGTGTNGTGGGIGQGPSQFGSGTFNLRILSNDKTLQEVLQSSTYDYMLEALDE